MNKQELKKLLKPLVKECIQESLIEGGVLSGIIAEVVSGMNRAPMLTETTHRPRNTTQEVDHDAQLERRRIAAEQQRQERIRSLNESTAGQFGGVNIFEGTTPTKADSGAHSAPGSLSGVDPSDAGVDISGLQALVGGHWNKLGKKR